MIGFTRGDILGLLHGVRPQGADAAMALCPFHRHRDGSREKCASMRVHLGTERYFCFACKAEGDLAELLTAYSGSGGQSSGSVTGQADG